MRRRSPDPADPAPGGCVWIGGSGRRERVCVCARAYMSLRTFTITTTTSPISNKIVFHTFIRDIYAASL